MAPVRLVSKTHVVMNAPNGDSFAIVSYTTGELGIARNDIPIADLVWASHEMSACTGELLRLVNLPASDVP